MAGEAKEKCAVVGFVGFDPSYLASGPVFESLMAMQHRGAEAAGAAASAADGVKYHSGNGLVPHVLTPPVVKGLIGSRAIGHNRYTTSGSNANDYAQPVVDPDIGLAFAHNGNLPDVGRAEEFLQSCNIRTGHLNDSGMMGRVIAQFIRGGSELPDAIEQATNYFDGAYSCVAMHDGLVVAFRDPLGIRPLAIGKSKNGYAVASETCGLDIIDASYEREVAPGEMVVITPGGVESRQIAEGQSKLDMFELVYFSRHDSYLEGQRVNSVRQRFGEKLASEHPPRFGNYDSIVVVPVPDTSVPASQGYAEALRLTHKQAVIKNRYIGRTFMEPTDLGRKEHLKRKHNIISEDVAGKDVIFIDDSVVRGNTMPVLVELAREAKAKTVTVLIASPPVRFPDFYGIDTPSQKDLVAANMTIEEMRRAIKCDYLGFLSLSGMVKSTGLPAERFNLSCFNGEYPICIGRRAKEIYSPVCMAA